MLTRILLCGAIAAAVLLVSGCGSSVLLRVYTVEDPAGKPTVTKEQPDLARFSPVGGVKFFFYPFAKDSVIHQVPEREFLTDRRGRAEYEESISPMGDKMAALVAMKYGFAVDTVFFRFEIGDTLNVLVPMRRK